MEPFLFCVLSSASEFVLGPRAPRRAQFNIRHSPFNIQHSSSLLDAPTPSPVSMLAHRTCAACAIRVSTFHTHFLCANRIKLLDTPFRARVSTGNTTKHEGEPSNEDETPDYGLIGSSAAADRFGGQPRHSCRGRRCRRERPALEERSDPR